MGSKKKKKGGGRKGRASLKDHNSLDGDDNELLSEEITALYVIYYYFFFFKSLNPFSYCPFFNICLQTNIYDLYKREKNGHLCYCTENMVLNSAEHL